jgi:hypothetical protein
MANAPNYYSTQAALGNATTSGIIVAFGFDATAMRLANYEAVDMYVNLVGNLPTTADLYLRACSDRILSAVPRLAGLGVVTTSTSAVAKILRVTALGG